MAGENAVWAVDAAGVYSTSSKGPPFALLDHCGSCCLRIKDSSLGSIAGAAVSLSVSGPGAVLGVGVVVGSAIVTSVGSAVVAPGGSYA